MTTPARSASSFSSSARTPQCHGSSRSRKSAWAALLAIGLGFALLVCPGAAECVTVIGERPGGSRDPSDGQLGLEFGPTFSLPIAAASASRDQLGLDAGFHVTLTGRAGVGAGLDVAYHYWPVSGEFKESFNHLFRMQTFNTLELGGATWSLSALQYTAHWRFTTPEKWTPRGWIRVGGGFYDLDPHTTGYSGDAGFFTVRMGPLKTTHHFGWYCATGCDLPGGRWSRLGLDATYHRVGCRDAYGSDLQVFTVGAHALIGL